MRFFFLTCLAAASSYILAQVPEVILSESFNMPEGKLITNKILPLGDNFAIHSIEYNPRYHIEFKHRESGLTSNTLFIHDKNLNRISTQDLPRKNIIKSREIVSLNNNLTWVYEKQVSEDSTIAICATMIKPEGKTTAEIDILTYPPKEKDDHLLFSATSSDRSKYACVLTQKKRDYVYLKNADTENTTCTVFVLDNAGQKISLATLTADVSRGRFEVLDVGLNNQGTVYFVTREFEEENLRKRKKNPISVLKLHTLQASSSKINSIRINTNEHYIRQIKFISTNNNSIALLGTYSSEYLGGVEGLFYEKNLQDLLNINPRPFSSKELIRMGPSIAHHKKNNSYLDYFVRLNSASVNPDNSVLITLEMYHFVPRQKVPNGKSIPPTHHFKDAVSFRLTPTHEIRDVLFLPKNQESRYTIKPWNGANGFNYKGKSVMMYNDNPKNIEGALNSYAKRIIPSRGIAVIGFLNESNKIIRKRLLPENKSENSLVSPSSFSQTKNGDLVFSIIQLSKKDKQIGYRLGKIVKL